MPGVGPPKLTIAWPSVHRFIAIMWIRNQHRPRFLFGRPPSLPT